MGRSYGRTPVLNAFKIYILDVAISVEHLHTALNGLHPGVLNDFTYRYAQNGVSFPQFAAELAVNF